MHDLNALTRAYLADFSAKSLAGLEKRFSADVSLRDWEIGLVRGRAAVLEANKKIFDGVKTIEGRPLKIYRDGSTGKSNWLRAVSAGNEFTLSGDMHGRNDFFGHQFQSPSADVAVHSC